MRKPIYFILTVMNFSFAGIGFLNGEYAQGTISLVVGALMLAAYLPLKTETKP